jgi:hypothetical protein
MPPSPGTNVLSVRRGLLSRLPLWYLQELIVFADIEISTGVIDGQTDDEKATRKYCGTRKGPGEAQA